METFNDLPKDRQTQEALAEIVNRNTDFSITRVEAATILAREKNEYCVKGHKWLDTDTVPKIHDFKEFYVNGDEAR